MKNTLHFFKLIIAVLLLTNVASAQALLQFENPPATVEGSIDEAVLQATFGVTNVSSQTVSITVEREELEIVEGTMNYFCWEQCYSPEVSVSPTDIEIAPGETVNNFYADYRSMGIAGTSTMRYCFYPTSAPENRTCTDISFIASFPTAIGDKQQAERFSEAYPNPALSGFTKFKYNPTASTTKAYVAVYDILGSEVKRVDLTNKSGVITLNTADLETGIYILSLYENQHLSQSNRLVVGE